MHDTIKYIFTFNTIFYVKINDRRLNYKFLYVPLKPSAAVTMPLSIKFANKLSTKVTINILKNLFKIYNANKKGYINIL